MIAFGEVGGENLPPQHPEGVLAIGEETLTKLRLVANLPMERGARIVHLCLSISILKALFFLL